MTLLSFDRTADQINLTLAVLAFVFFVSILFLKFSKPENIGDILASTRNVIADFQVLNLSKKSSKYYERILSRRELFAAQTGLKVQKPEPGHQTQDAAAGEDLQLLGIVTGAQGPQAIIMNTKSGQSYYCSGGEEINGFTVKSILENKVILENDGEMKEIRL